MIKVKSDFGGAVDVHLRIEPEHMHAIDYLLTKLLDEVHAAQRSIEIIEMGKQQEKEAYAKGKAESQRLERKALALVKSKGVKAAAEETGLGVTWVRLAMAEDKKKRTKRKLLQRNRKIMAMHVEGCPIKVIAEKFGLHEKSICRLIKGMREEIESMNSLSKSVEEAGLVHEAIPVRTRSSFLG